MKIHTKKWLEIGTSTILLCAGSQVFAATPLESMQPLLPNQVEVKASLSQYPTFLSTLSGVDYANAHATLLQKGENPWTVRTGFQVRQTKNNDLIGDRTNQNSYEPSIGLEKRFRWAGKSQLDYKIGEQGIAIATLKKGDAWHEAAKELLANWFKLMRADMDVNRIEEQLKITQQQIDVINLRIKAGDAPQLERMLLTTEYNQTEERLLQAQANRQQAQMTLARYFKGRIPEHFSTEQIQLIPNTETENDWINKALQDNHEYELAVANAERQHELVRRQALNKTPDPILGLSLSREQRGTEHLLGVSLSVPLGFTQAKLATDMASAEASQADIEVDKIKTRIIGDTSILYLTVKDAERRMRKSQKILDDLMQQNSIMNKAYKLGELSINEWLLSSKQLIDGKTRLDQAKMDYAENLSLYLLNSHQLWPFESE